MMKERSTSSGIVLRVEINPNEATSAIASSTDVLDRIADVASRILAADKAENSQRAYESRMRAWGSFCVQHGAQAFPAEPVTVIGWIASMADAGLSLSTIRQSVAAMRYACAMRGEPSPTDDPEVIRAVRGAARLYGRPRRPKKALLLDGLRKTLPAGRGERSIQARALLLLGWYSALRRSELAALRVGDVEVTDEGLVIHVRRSKTDQSGQGTMRGVPYQSDSALCPVRAVTRWASTRSAGQAERPEDPFFRVILRGGRVSDRGIGPKWVARVVQRTCERAGMSPKDFAGHSLRRGFATEAARRGKPLEAIQHHLRHASIATTQRYVEEGKLFDEKNPATGMA
jgi:integrase